VAKVDVKVPDIGDFNDVPVIEVLVKPGDVVKAEQSLISLESDKAAMDVPSPVEGTVAEVVAKVGDKVSMGTLIARIESGEGETKAQAAPAKTATSPVPAKAAAAQEKGSAAARPAKSGGSASAEAAAIDITIPDIGDFKDVPVIEILVKVGDTVEAEQPIVTLESDKASMDVPSPAAGKITEIVVKVGDKVSMGSLVGKLDAGGSAGSVSRGQEGEADAKEEEDAAEAPETSPVAPADLPPRPPKPGSGPALPDFSGVFAGPAVRRLARELGLDLNQLKGTGEKGRITREDLKAALSKGAAAPAGGCPQRRRSTSPNSVQSRRSRSRASRRSRVRGCTPPGSTFRTSRIRMKRTSPISTPSGRRSTKTRRKRSQSLTAYRCCRFSCELRSRR
jgi:pyruvate dehydrogenase E2 component (dihydrolipoamide acetyltransferase)